MLDLRFIIENIESVRANCAMRNVSVDLERLLALDERRRALIAEQQSVQERRNGLAREIKGRKPSDDERNLGKELKEREAVLEAELAGVRDELTALHVQVPNLTHPDVPAGATDEENRELRVIGAPPAFGFAPLDHVELAEKHDLIDFEAGAKVSGQKFYFLKNEMVLLEHALVRFALDLLRKRGFTLFQTPDVARAEVADGLGFNPRGAETNIYSIAGTDLVLVGTAEITLGGIHHGETNLTVFERLKEDFGETAAIFDTDPLIPTAWRGDWHMSVVLAGRSQRRGDGRGALPDEHPPAVRPRPGGAAESDGIQPWAGPAVSRARPWIPARRCGSGSPATSG